MAIVAVAAGRPPLAVHDYRAMEVPAVDVASALREAVALEEKKLKEKQQAEADNALAEEVDHNFRVYEIAFSYIISLCELTARQIRRVCVPARCRGCPSSTTRWTQATVGVAVHRPFLPLVG